MYTYLFVCPSQNTQANDSWIGEKIGRTFDQDVFGTDVAEQAYVSRVIQENIIIRDRIESLVARVN